MSFFHLRNVPGYQWPALPDAVISQAWNAYLELDRTQWLSPVELEQHQLRQVRALLTHCVANVPYYRQVLPDAGINPQAIQTMDDFRRIPLLPRRVYQENHASFVATNLPPGTSAGDRTQTSGSSGTPTYTYGTNMTSLWWHAFYLRDLEWSNIDPTGSLAVLRYTSTTGAELQQMLQGVSFPCWSSALDPLIESGPVHGMDIRQDPHVQWDWLRRIAPDYVLSYPDSLAALAALAQNGDVWPNLRVIQSMGSHLSAETRSMIGEVFRVPVKNIYSCNEAGYLASPCPKEGALHIHAENVILEILDEKDQPCKPGQPGRVFVTHLHNLGGPLIRYELGDEATLAADPCPCGRGLPRLANVQGKKYPMFRLPTGSLKNCVVLAGQLRKIGGFWQYQVIQKSLAQVVIRLAKDPTWSETHAKQIEGAVHEFFEAPITVDLEFHEFLALPGSGKFQSMINEIPGD